MDDSAAYWAKNTVDHWAKREALTKLPKDICMMQWRRSPLILNGALICELLIVDKSICSGTVARYLSLHNLSTPHLTYV